MKLGIDVMSLRSLNWRYIYPCKMFGEKLGKI